MAGRGKKKIISKRAMAKAKGYAYDGCQNGTICGLMGWPDNFIAQRPDIRKILLKKRQERYAWLRKLQFEQAEKFPPSAMFLGKNYLGQADKKETVITDERASEQELESMREVLRSHQEPLKLIKGA